MSGLGRPKAPLLEQPPHHLRMSNHPSIGQDCQLVLLWAGVRIDLRDVTGFQSRQVVEKIRAHPLNGDPVEIVAQKGWEGRFEVDRGNGALDRLINDIEQAFRFGGGAPWSMPGQNTISTDPMTGKTVSSQTITSSPGKIYQYVTERGGGLTTIEFTGCTIVLEDAGNWRASAVTKQSLSFFAGARNLL